MTTIENIYIKGNNLIINYKGSDTPIIGDIPPLAVRGMFEVNNNEQKIQDFISQIEIISSMIVSHFNHINSDKKLISKLQININNREKDLNNINSKILKLIQINSNHKNEQDYIEIEDDNLLI